MQHIGIVDYIVMGGLWAVLIVVTIIANRAWWAMTPDERREWRDDPMNR